MSAPRQPGLVITASPHVRSQDSTPVIMWNVVGTLVPAIAAARIPPVAAMQSKE